VFPAAKLCARQWYYNGLRSRTLVLVCWNAMPRGAREAGHSNILWTGLLMAWCCSTSGNQHRQSHSRTIPRPNIGATTRSGRGMRKAKPLVTWRVCSTFPCSGSARLCSNGGSKTPIFPKTDERSKPARFSFGDRINGIGDDQDD
jgi:hypothetical protein